MRDLLSAMSNFLVAFRLVVPSNVLQEDNVEVAQDAVSLLHAAAAHFPQLFDEIFPKLLPLVNTKHLEVSVSLLKLLALRQVSMLLCFPILPSCCNCLVAILDCSTPCCGFSRKGIRQADTKSGKRFEGPGRHRYY